MALVAGGAIYFGTHAVLQNNSWPLDTSQHAQLSAILPALLAAAGTITAALVGGGNAVINWLAQRDLAAAQSKYLSALEDKKNKLNEDLEIKKAALTADLDVKKNFLNGQLEEKKTNLTEQLEQRKATLTNQLEDRKATLNSQLEDRKSTLNGQLEDRKSALSVELEREKAQFEILKSEVARNLILFQRGTDVVCRYANVMRGLRRGVFDLDRIEDSETEMRSLLVEFERDKEPRESLQAFLTNGIYVKERAERRSSAAGYKELWTEELDGLEISTIFARFEEQALLEIKIARETCLAGNALSVP